MPRNYITGRVNAALYHEKRGAGMTKPKRHHVKFVAKETVTEPVQVKFTTKDGKKVSFPGHKKVKEEVEVDFMAKNKKK